MTLRFEYLRLSVYDLSDSSHGWGLDPVLHASSRGGDENEDCERWVAPT